MPPQTPQTPQPASADKDAPCKTSCGFRHLDIQACAQDEGDCRVTYSAGILGAARAAARGVEGGV